MAIFWALLALLYLAGIFYLARWGEKGSDKAKRLAQHPLSYSLALAIYCTAWTYFGAVGESARTGWNYLPIFIGPMLVYLFGYKFLNKMALVVREQRITTIADFIASRYGKRQLVALFVTTIALLATIPYIALQLKAVGASFNLVSGAENAQGVILAATVIIALIASSFGSNKADVTEFRAGLSIAIAFESLIKLAALVVLAGFAYFSLDWQSEAVKSARSHFDWSFDQFFSSSFWVQALMAAAAVICLPRQFHIAFVGHSDGKHRRRLKSARILFPLYLLAIASLIPFIAVAGNALFAGSGSENADIYVLRLAQWSESLSLQVLVFVGGLSAATAMVIVAALTLSTMITNDVILPMLLARQNQHDRAEGGFESRIVAIRRAVVAGILLLAFFYQQLMANSSSLASIGLLAFSLVIQLLPAIIGGLYWKRGHALGVCAGLMGGLSSWVFWLLLQAFPQNGVDSIQAAQLTDSMISYGALLSLGVNTALYIVFSLFAQPRLTDRLQAQVFVSPKQQLDSVTNTNFSKVKSADLIQLLGTFLGRERSKNLIEEYHRSTPDLDRLKAEHAPTQGFVEFCERALGGVIGAASARSMVRAALHREKLDFEEVVSFLDDTTQAIQFNQSILFTTLENLKQGICVVDRDLKLVFWNRGYQELFDYPDNMMFVGQDIAKLIYFNVANGECGPGQMDDLVHKRIDHLRRRTPHRFLRRRQNGRVIEMIGEPIAEGGFLTSFNDITEHIEAQQALEEANINLEKRVLARSAETKSINDLLRAEVTSRAQAEKKAFEANASKTKFLAQASHDILQPMNAARLYLAAIEDSQLPQVSRQLVDKVRASVASADDLIATLLEIARLDQGGMQAKLEPVNVQALGQKLVDEYRITARAKGLELHFFVSARHVWVLADKTFLRRIIQNLLGNAIKYTAEGKVLLAIRPVAHSKDLGGLRVQIIDTGPGIERSEQEKIYSDFYRVSQPEGSAAISGVGLGLGVVSRLAESLDIKMRLRSRVGHGSNFEFSLPVIEPPKIDDAVHKEHKAAMTQSLAGLRVLCLDDSQENLNAMQALLERWHCQIRLVSSFDQALSVEEPIDVILADYEIATDSNTASGLDLIQAYRDKRGVGIAAVLITANREADLKDRCQDMDVYYHPKPVKPAKLRALMNKMSQELSA